MGSQTPPTLKQLVIESLLKKEEALAMFAAVEGLPRSLIPETFEVAFRNNQTNILRAMVPAWPFTCLPVGALMKTPHLETLKALLDGLDVLISEEACPRRGKIRVLDLTDVDYDFWSIWNGMYKKDCCHDDMRQKKKPAETCPYSGLKNYLNIVTDLKLENSQLDECAMYLWQWAQQRKGSVHLCCRKLEILEPCLSNAIDILRSVDLHCIRELKVIDLCLEDMALFGPYLGQMRNLHTLMLESIVNTFGISEAEELEDELMNSLFSQFSKLHCLQHLYVDDIYVLVGSLEEWLGCLKKPLETLSITFCHLIQRDLDYLPQCPNLSGLRHLTLSHTILGEWFEPLGKLLERVKDTLQTLDLEKCWLEDSAFSAFMPALSQCSQLLRINFSNNKLSLPLLKQLLHHTAKLNKLTEELYPVPLECYDNRGLRERFGEICTELLDILRSERQPKAVSFKSTICPICSQSCVYALENRHCLCWQ
ncbi:PRAME family member 12 [Microtus ochrogaster]|uniref:PRAME family member 12 n=1 Tax=Microtus ochrogaster TaxID=79684 RepID=A0A8J6KS47_MICOH|nr:PRAME family member 12 [Microtus ochrogaster]